MQSGAALCSMQHTDNYNLSYIHVAQTLQNHREDSYIYRPHLCIPATVSRQVIRNHTGVAYNAYSCCFRLYTLHNCMTICNIYLFRSCLQGSPTQMPPKPLPMPELLESPMWMCTCSLVRHALSLLESRSGKWWITSVARSTDKSGWTLRCANT